MKIPTTDIETVGEAKQKAIDWQKWQSTKALSYGEINKWVDFFKILAKKFNLTEEFKENGII